MGKQKMPGRGRVSGEPESLKPAIILAAGGVVLLAWIGVVFYFAEGRIPLAPEVLSYVIYVLAGAFAALITAAALSFSGRATGTVFGVKFQVAGPAVAWLAVTSAGLLTPRKGPDEGPTSFAFEIDGKPVLVSGELEVRCKDGRPDKQSFSKATAVTFPRFPHYCHEEDVTLYLTSSSVDLLTTTARTSESQAVKLTVAPKKALFLVNVRDFQSLPPDTAVYLVGSEKCVQYTRSEIGAYVLSCPEFAASADVEARFLVKDGSFKCDEFALNRLDDAAKSSTIINFADRCHERCSGDPSETGKPPPTLPPTPVKPELRSASPSECEAARSYLRHLLEPEVGQPRTGSISFLQDQAVGQRTDGQAATYRLDPSKKMTLANCQGGWLFN